MLDRLPPLTAEQVQVILWDLVKQAQNSWKLNKPRVVVAADGQDYVEGKVEAEGRTQSRQAAHSYPETNSKCAHEQCLVLHLTHVYHGMLRSIQVDKMPLHSCSKMHKAPTHKLKTQLLCGNGR